MNVVDVMDEIGRKLRQIDGLNVADWDAEDVSVPAALVPLPDRIDYDKTYGRGSDGITIEFMIVIGLGNKRAASKQAAEFAAPSGPRSVREKVGAAPNNRYEYCDDVQVQSCEFDVVRIAGTDYLGCVFTAMIAGNGRG